MKRLLFSSVALLVVFSAFTWAENPPVIAIVELSGSGLDSSELLALTNRLRAELFETQKYTVVERSQMETILKEQGFQQAGCTDAACAVEIGKLLNAQFILLGTVDHIGHVFSVNIRQVNVENGQIVNNVKNDCADCSIEDVMLKQIRTTALKLVGLDAADKSDEKVSDALKVQQFLYKGKRTGKLGSITFNVKPVQSHVVFDDSGYGLGNVLIENVPVKKKHTYQIMPESRRFIPNYGTVRIGSDEIVDVSIALRKSYFTIGVGYSLAFFNGEFSMPADSFSVDTTQSGSSAKPVIPITVRIKNTGAVPATMITANLGAETRWSYYSLVSHYSFGNLFSIPDRENHDREHTGVNHGTAVFNGDTLYYGTYAYFSFAAYFSYMRKVLNVRDALMICAGLNAGFCMTKPVVDFYRFRSSTGRDYWNVYNKSDLAPSFATSSTLYGTATGSGEFAIAEHGDGQRYFKIEQYDFGGPVLMATVGAPQDRVRFFVHYMLGLGMNHYRSSNVKLAGFDVANEFKAGWMIRL